MNKQVCIDQDEGELYDRLVQLASREEASAFFKDLCTPQERAAMTERWQVCRLLARGDLSYREIHERIGTSLATITRVARFLKDEPHGGYRAMLKKTVS